MLVFQSTPSLRRATFSICNDCKFFSCFNPRPPCGERQKYETKREMQIAFQSTPSLRRATIFRAVQFLEVGFQSTPSLRRATARHADISFAGNVSIHALLAESDKRPGERWPKMECFNPRPPCGERQNMRPLPRMRRSFNPRPPCGERLPQRYMLLINHASGALRQLHEDGTSHTVFSSSYLVVNLRFPMSYKNRRLPGNLM